LLLEDSERWLRKSFLNGTLSPLSGTPGCFGAVMGASKC
jgi:hypothetical protein